MTKRVFRSTFLVALAVLAASLALIMGVLYSYFSNEYLKELKNESAFVVQGLSLKGEEYLNGLPSGSDRITWIDGDGTVLYDSQADSASMENHSDREEFVEAQESGTGESVRYSKTLSERTMNYAVQMEDGSVLRVSTTQLSVGALVWGMLQQILMVVAVAIALSGLLAYRTSKQVVEPLNKVDLEHPLESSEDIYDELAPFLTRIEQQNRQINRQIQTLKEQKEEFDTITDRMDEGLIILNHKGEILSINRRGAEIFGAEGDCLGKHIYSLSRSTKLMPVLEKSLKGEAAQTDFSLNERDYQILASPVEADSQRGGAVVLILDVTESRQAERLRREFSANVSHELKTPLTSISGYAELMQSGMVKEEDMVPFAGRIYQEANRLIHLVEDIIRLSQLDEGDSTFRKEPVELLGLSEQVCEELKEAAEKRQVTVQVTGSPCVLVGVSRVLEEMIYNLVDNAIKYNKEGGSVTVNVQVKERDALLSVSDTGVGIPAEHQSRVFERFYRVDKSHSRATGGTGLGLSIVKHGAQLHGAEVSLDSKVGVGTTITLRFPL